MKDRKQRLLPAGVPRYIRCYDNGGESWDRFTVAFTGHYRKRGDWFQYVAMSSYPFDAQGIGQHGEHQRQIDVNNHGFAPAIGRKNHLGWRIPFRALPADCRKLVLRDYKEIWSL